MSASSISEIPYRSTISYVNEERCEPKKSYIFVFGVENDLEEAEAGARSIASRLGNKRVVLFYNPTKLTDPSALKTHFLIQRLLDLIHSEFRRCDRNPNAEVPIIRIFSHSHGSVLTKRAMELAEDLRNGVELVSLGGGVLIPNNLARKVRNIVNEFDLVPLLGNNPMPEDFRTNVLNQRIGEFVSREIA